MTDLSAYYYRPLRYVHDVATGEFINVGMLLHCPSTGFFQAKTRTTLGRLTKMFPGANGVYFRQKLRSVQVRATYIRDEAGGKIVTGSIDQLARDVLPKDDSSFQWGPLASGLTSNAEKTLAHLYVRYVTRYDGKVPEEKKSDDEVWSVFSKALHARRISPKLEEKTIAGSVDEVKFEHAWKNGVWHCFEPLSFDLVDPESIRSKAHRWLGQMSAVRDSTDLFKVYFLIGEPACMDGRADRTGRISKVRESFDKARLILEQIPVPKSIYTEDQADDFSRDVEAEFVSHRESHA